MFKITRQPVCKKCGSKEWRKIGLEPTNKIGSSKGWRGKNSKGYHHAAERRLFTKVYACKKCKSKIRYGNAGRPIT